MCSIFGFARKSIQYKYTSDGAVSELKHAVLMRTQCFVQIKIAAERKIQRRYFD